MKIYVDEIPKSCDDCEFGNGCNKDECMKFIKEKLLKG